MVPVFPSIRPPSLCGLLAPRDNHVTTWMSDQVADERCFQVDRFHIHCLDSLGGRSNSNRHNPRCPVFRPNCHSREISQTRSKAAKKRELAWSFIHERAT